MHVAWKHDLNIKTMNPTLFKSLQAIHVQHVKAATKMQEAVQNMKMASRGEIRKRTNVIQTVWITRNLYSFGLSHFGVFVREWNGQCVRSEQIVGKRALTLKLLFEAASPDFWVTQSPWGASTTTCVEVH